MKHVITVGPVEKGFAYIGIEDGRAAVADSFRVGGMGEAVEILSERLGKRIERRGPGTKGPKMEYRIWRVKCPGCGIISSIHESRHQTEFRCPISGCTFRGDIKDEGEI